MSESNNSPLGFMNWYLKLFIISINRKRFELTNIDGRLWALNNSKNTIWAIIFFGLGSLFIFSGFIELSQTNDPIDTAFILVFFVAHPIIGILFLRQFLWLINGRQELIVESGNLTLSKKGTFFTSDKTYPIKEIKNIRFAVDESKLSPVEKLVNRTLIFRKSFTTQVFGEILFDYQYNNIKVFNDLDDNQKELLIEELLKCQKQVDLENIAP